jgi:hypothetical protein
MSPKENSHTRSQNVAALTTTGLGTVFALAKYVGDDVELLDLSAEIRKSVEEVAAGNLTRIEGILAAQILLLNTLSVALFQRAPTSGDFESSLKLGLKCQSQCRATAETLGALKNPAPYIREANIAAGHQQINHNYAHAEENNNAPNELLRRNYGTALDSGGAGTSGGSHPGLAAVVGLKRASNAKR